MREIKFRAWDKANKRWFPYYIEGGAGMRFRLFNKLYADLMGYFWLPCPLCGQYFGGHEWTHSSQSSTIIGKNEQGRECGKGICPDCTKKGLGTY